MQPDLPAVPVYAELQMWLREINRPGLMSREKLIAAERVCEIMGVATALRAVSAQGMLRPAPPWPLVDIVPIGAGPAVVTCSVRSAIGGVRREVKVAIERTDGKPYAAAITEALARGKFELSRWV